MKQYLITTNDDYNIQITLDNMACQGFEVVTHHVESKPSINVNTAYGYSTITHRILWVRDVVQSAHEPTDDGEQAPTG